MLYHWNLVNLYMQVEETFTNFIQGFHKVPDACVVVVNAPLQDPLWLVSPLQHVIFFCCLTCSSTKNSNSSIQPICSPSTDPFTLRYPHIWQQCFLWLHLESDLLAYDGFMLTLGNKNAFKCNFIACIKNRPYLRLCENPSLPWGHYTTANTNRIPHPTIFGKCIVPVPQ